MSDLPIPTAAFVRVEGVLFDRGLLQTALYMSFNRQSFSDRILKFGQVALSAPLSKVLEHTDPTFSNRIVSLAFKGMSEDRISVLGNEFYRDVLKPRLKKEGMDLLSRLRKQGHRIALISDSIEEVVSPLEEEIGPFDALFFNRVEYKNGLATGKLRSPVVGGVQTKQFIEDYAEKNGIDLRRSLAYASYGSDQTFMSNVGKPCAFQPDFVLRQVAKEVSWPIL